MCVGGDVGHLPPAEWETLVPTQPVKEASIKSDITPQGNPHGKRRGVSPEFQVWGHWAGKGGNPELRSQPLANKSPL